VGLASRPWSKHRLDAGESAAKKVFFSPTTEADLARTPAAKWGQCRQEEERKGESGSKKKPEKE
jgi:hypothetical protein